AEQTVLDELRQRYQFGDGFNREVEKHFEAAVLKQYIEAFEAFLQKSRAGWPEVGAASNAHRGTVARWIKGELRPSLEKIFLYLALEGIRVEDVGFPGGEEAKLAAAANTLVYIRRKYLATKNAEALKAEGTATCIRAPSAEESGTLTGGQLQGLIHAYRSRRWAEARGEKELEEALGPVVGELRALSPRC